MKTETITLRVWPELKYALKEKVSDGTLWEVRTAL